MFFHVHGVWNRYSVTPHSNMTNPGFDFWSYLYMNMFLSSASCFITITSNMTIWTKEPIKNSIKTQPPGKKFFLISKPSWAALPFFSHVVPKIWFYENDQVNPLIISRWLLYFALSCLLAYEVLLATRVVVVVHCRQVLLVVCSSASWKGSQHRVSYLVCHRVWIEELASYLDREVWRGTLPTATNTTLFKVHKAVNNHVSSYFVSKVTSRAGLKKINKWRILKLGGKLTIVREQTMRGQWSKYF